MLPILIENLTQEIQKLPGVGKRGAQKMALDILQHSQTNFENLNLAIHKMRQEVFFCDNCGFFAGNENGNLQNNFASPFEKNSQISNKLQNFKNADNSKLKSKKIESQDSTNSTNLEIPNLETENEFSKNNLIKIEKLETESLESDSQIHYPKVVILGSKKIIETNLQTKNDNLENSQNKTNSTNLESNSQDSILQSGALDLEIVNLEISTINSQKLQIESENPQTETLQNSQEKKQILENPQTEKPETESSESDSQITQRNCPNSEKISHISHSYNNYLQDFLPIPTSKLCQICQNSHRNPFQICLVEKPTDILNIEKSQIYQGFYHVLGKLISPLDKVFVENTKLPDLFDRRLPELLEILQKLNQNIFNSNNSQNNSQTWQNSTNSSQKTSQNLEQFEEGFQNSQNLDQNNSQSQNSPLGEKIENSTSSNQTLSNFTNLKTPNQTQIIQNENEKTKNFNSANNSQKIGFDSKSQNHQQIELILFFKTGFSAEATTAYLREKIYQESWENEIKITKLAEGLPLYYNPDNLDQATMIKALEDRKNLW